MPILKRINKYQGLKDIDVLVEESGLTSKYFNILEVPENIPKGTSSFLLAGSQFLKPNVELRIEILDSRGQPIYTEPIINYLEGNARRVSIEVYDDTAPGDGFLYVCGELREDYLDIENQSRDDIDIVGNVNRFGRLATDDQRDFQDRILPDVTNQTVPEEFRNVYNVRYIRPIFINSTIPNTERIIFHKQPSVSVSEIVKGYVSTTPVATAVNLTGSVSVDITNEAEPIEPNVETGDGKAPVDKSERDKVGRDLEIFKNRRREKINVINKPSFTARGRVMRRFSPETEKATIKVSGMESGVDNSNGKVSSAMVGATLTINNPKIDEEQYPSSKFTIPTSYTTKIKKVKNSTTLIPQDEFFVTDKSTGVKYPVSLANPANAFMTLSLDTTSLTQNESVSTTHFRSFADITVGNLRTFSGDVYKAKLYTRSKGTLGDFEPVYETVIESPQLLIDPFSPTGFKNTGFFHTQSIIDDYWLTTNGTATKNDDYLIDGVLISGSNFVKGTTTTFTTSGSGFELENGVVHTIKFNSFYFKESKEISSLVTENKATLKVYLSGSATTGNAEEDVFLGEVDLDTNSPDSGQVDGVFNTFISSNSGDPKTRIRFEVEAGRWVISDVELKPYSETNFNPDYFRMILPMPHPMPKKPDQYDFLVEFYTSDNQIAETFALREDVNFAGAPINIDGDGNLLSGSMYLGNVEGSGIEMHGGSAYVRTIGYNGFDNVIGSGSGGFMMFSGSVGTQIQASETGSYEYQGVGLEIVDAHTSTNRYLRFRTNPSIFEVVTDQFFLGSENGSFVSGALGNIEISSSNFHLTAEGDVTMSGTISATAGNIGDFQIIEGQISGSNITMNAPKSQIFKTDQGPGSDTSATFDQLRDEYYIDFTPSGSNDPAGTNYYVKFGPKFMVDKDGLLIASGATFEGSVTASAGLIGGFTTDSSSFHSTNIFISGSPAAGGVDDSKYMFISTSNFNVKENGDITGSSVLFTGGTIGGFDIVSDGISSTNNVFQVTGSTGQITGSNVLFTGGTIGGFTIDGHSLTSTGVEINDATQTYFISSSNFKVKHDGEISGSQVLFTGGKIAGWTIDSSNIFSDNLFIRSSGTIETADFASNLRGWRISAEGNGTAEFENARIRGTLSTAVFEKETVNAVGGQLYVANSTSITGSTGVTASHTTMSVVNSTGFTGSYNNDGEILSIKKVTTTGFSTEYVLVQSSSRDFPTSETNFAGKLYVVRGYSGSSATNSGSEAAFVGDLQSTPQNYEEGQVIVSTGRIGSGYIRLNANPNDTTTPYIDIVERTGSAIYDVDLKARIGDLSGVNVSEFAEFGITPANAGFGIYTQNGFFTGGITATTGSITGRLFVHTGVGATNRIIIGTDVNGSNDGISVNDNNYWYTTGAFKVGSSTNFLSHDGSGDIQIQSQNFELDTPNLEISSANVSMSLGEGKILLDGDGGTGGVPIIKVDGGELSGSDFFVSTAGALSASAFLFSTNLAVDTDATINFGESNYQSFAYGRDDSLKIVTGDFNLTTPKLIVSSSNNGVIALGSTPPQSATAGSGIFLKGDGTFLFGNTSADHINFDGSTLGIKTTDIDLLTTGTNKIKIDSTGTYPEIALGRTTLNTSVAGTERGIYMNGSGSFLVRGDGSNFIKMDASSTTLELKSDTFQLDASTIIMDSATNNGKIQLGPSGGPGSATGTSNGGAYIDGQGRFNFVGDANNYIRFSATGLEVNTDDFTIAANGDVVSTGTINSNTGTFGGTSNGWTIATGKLHNAGASGDNDFIGLVHSSQAHADVGSVSAFYAGADANTGQDAQISFGGDGKIRGTGIYVRRGGGQAREFLISAETIFGGGEDGDVLIQPNGSTGDLKVWTSGSKTSTPTYTSNSGTTQDIVSPGYGDVMMKKYSAATDSAIQLERDVYVKRLILDIQNSSLSFKMNGYRLFASEGIFVYSDSGGSTHNANIFENGRDGTDGNAGSNGDQRNNSTNYLSISDEPGGSGGSAGSSYNSGTLVGVQAAGAGGAGGAGKGVSVDTSGGSPGVPSGGSGIIGSSGTTPTNPTDGLSNTHPMINTLGGRGGAAGGAGGRSSENSAAQGGGGASSAASVVQAGIQYLSTPADSIIKVRGEFGSNDYAIRLTTAPSNPGGTGGSGGSSDHAENAGAGGAGGGSVNDRYQTFSGGGGGGGGGAGSNGGIVLVSAKIIDYYNTSKYSVDNGANGNLDVYSPGNNTQYGKLKMSAVGGAGGAGGAGGQGGGFEQLV